MPYPSISKLPASVRNNLPKHAQAIYRKAFENAWDEYKAPEKRRGQASREEAAHKVAWSAVKTQYKKNGTGEWSARSNSSMAKSPRQAASKAASKARSANSATKKSARKSAAKVKGKSQTVKKAGAKSAAKSRQPRWKEASAQKTARKSRGKTAASGTGTTRQQKSRKSPKSALEYRNAGQESVNTSLQSGQGLSTPTPVQPDAVQVS